MMTLGRPGNTKRIDCSGNGKAGLVVICVEIDEFCIKNDGFCI